MLLTVIGLAFVPVESRHPREGLMAGTVVYPFLTKTTRDVDGRAQSGKGIEALGPQPAVRRGK
jgi:hypothetical protein